MLHDTVIHSLRTTRFETALTSSGDRSEAEQNTEGLSQKTESSSCENCYHLHRDCTNHIYKPVNFKYIYIPVQSTPKNSIKLRSPYTTEVNYNMIKYSVLRSELLLNTQSNCLSRLP